jgi:hypothetical protein
MIVTDCGCPLAPESVPWFRSGQRAVICAHGYTHVVQAKEVKTIDYVIVSSEAPRPKACRCGHIEELHAAGGECQFDPCSCVTYQEVQ